MSSLHRLLKNVRLSLTKPSPERAKETAKADSIRIDVIAQIAHSILYSEAPLCVQEYVFHVLPQQAVPYEIVTRERLDFVADLLLHGFNDEKKRQYLSYRSSVESPIPATGYLVHTHPRDTLEDLTTGPHFSSADKTCAKYRPLGLIEYAVSDQSHEIIAVVAQFSLCFGYKTELVRRYGIEFTQDKGVSVHSEGHRIARGQVPEFGFMPKGVKHALLDHHELEGQFMEAYVVKHAIRGIEEK